MERLIIVLPVLIAAYLATTLVGCAGMGVRAEAYRIDEMRSSERTYNKPLKCLFINCNTTSEGSAS